MSKFRWSSQKAGEIFHQYRGYPITKGYLMADLLSRDQDQSLDVSPTKKQKPSQSIQNPNPNPIQSQQFLYPNIGNTLQIDSQQSNYHNISKITNPIFLEINNGPSKDAKIKIAKNQIQTLAENNCKLQRENATTTEKVNFYKGMYTHMF